MDIENERLSLSQAVQAELQTLPVRRDAVTALESLPNRIKPGLFVEVDKSITKSTDLKPLFFYDEVTTAIELSSQSGVQVVEDERFAGSCSMNGHIRMVRGDVSRPFSERLRFLLNRGDYGNHTIEHELGHRRSQSPEIPLLRFLAESLNKNSRLMAGGVEIRETYARLCSIDDVCGSLSYTGGGINSSTKDSIQINRGNIIAKSKALQLI